MYEPIFELASFGTLPLEARKHLIGVACEFLIAVNREYLKRNPRTPDFYTISPSYALKERPFGIDRWQDIPQTLALREGDCKDFVCWRVAQLREAGAADCGPRIVATEAPGIISYHVQVRNDINVEDPSVAMGMPRNLTANQLRKLFTNGQATSGAGLELPPQNNVRSMAPQKITAHEVQILLSMLGAKPRVQMTGVFDPQTSAALASFQSRVGLAPTGFADPKSVHVLRQVVDQLMSKAA